MADKVFDLALARSHFARTLRLSMNGQSDAKRLIDLLSTHRQLAPADAGAPQGCPVTISYHNEQAGCEISLGASFRVIPSEQLAGGLSEWLAPENVEFTYS
jgi:DNA polymerase-3 subunit alpha